MIRGFGLGVRPAAYGMMGGGWLGWLLMVLLWALFVAAVVLLVVWLLRSVRSHGTHPGVAPGAPTAVGDEAIALARKRLASGEITKEQFDEIMTALRA